jgi:hypothetical protein
MSANVCQWLMPAADYDNHGGDYDVDGAAVDC